MNISNPLPPSVESPRRLRLSPQARIPLILDAALAEFSAQGYRATRIDDIATRAGLSKGGFYAHFASKEALFIAVIERTLVPPELDMAALLHQPQPSVRALVEHLVDMQYARFNDPTFLATARLLFAEGHRVPQVLADWHDRTIGQLLERMADLLRQCADRGWVRRSSVIDTPRLLVAPAVHTLLHLVTFGPSPAVTVPEARAAHVALLCELLEPHG